MTEKELEDRKRKIANLTEDQKKRRDALFAEWLEKVKQIPDDASASEKGNVLDGGIGSGKEYRRLEEIYLPQIRAIEDEND